MDLSQVETTFPLIANDTYCLWRVKAVSTEQKNLDGLAVQGVHANGAGTVLKMEFDLVEPAVDTEGKPILPGGRGGKFFESTNLYSKVGGKDDSWFVKKIAERVDALLGTEGPEGKGVKPKRPTINLASPNIAAELSQLLIGATLKAKMRVKTGEYTGNEFAKVYFPADLTA